MTESDYPTLEGAVCPLPLSHDETIVMGHGAGGKMSHELIRDIFQSRFINPALAENNDFGRLSIPTDQSGHLAVSTDMHMVTPLFFPGGDIGSLAICGTVNDIAMSGGIPLAITASFILEEGLSIRTLSAVVDSMAETARQVGIPIIAGDTKVAEKGSADKIFINTTGIAWVPEERRIGGQFACPGDVILLSGTMGDHGIAVLAARGELGFQADVKSDIAPLHGLIQIILRVAPNVHVLRDPTRGGVGTTLNEIARQSRTSLWIEEDRLPVHPTVQAACEMLGFDPLYIANEGKLIVICPPDEAEQALEAMRQHPYGKQAVVIGEVKAEDPGRVLMRTSFGAIRLVDTLAGEILPRIC